MRTYGTYTYIYWICVKIKYIKTNRVFAQHSYMNCFFIDKSLTAQKTLGEFMFESRYATIDQLYDKFSITKPIKLDLSDRLQKQRFIREQRAKSRVCVFAGYPIWIFMIRKSEVSTNVQIYKG